MGLSINEILTFGGLNDAEIIAGKNGATNLVESISVLEVAESKISKWVKKNELYITSFYAIRDNVEMQKIVIETLAKFNCCGLVICHINMWIKEFDKSIIELCKKLDFPLIVAKSETSFVEILNPIIGKLITYENVASDYSNIRNDLLDLIVDEEDVYEVFKKISYKMKYEVSFFDVNFNCIYSNKNDEIKDYEKNYLKDNFNSINEECKNNKYTFNSIYDSKELIYLIKSKRNFFGFILISYIDDKDRKSVITSAEHLSLASSLLFSRKNKIIDIKRNYEQEYIGDLIVWNFRSEEVAILRGREIGIDICDKNNVIVVNINAFQQKMDNNEINSISLYIRKWLLPNIKEMVKSFNVNNIVSYRSDTIIIIMENKEEAIDLKFLCNKIINLFKVSEKSTVSVGISDLFKSYKDIPQAYNQAFNSAIIGREYYGDNMVLSYTDTWFLHNLKSMKKDNFVVQKCIKILQPLEEYDSSQGTNLIETLKCIINNNMDLGIVANKLFIHRNTLLYRKNKIIEILGYNPLEMPYLINFIMILNILS